MHKHFLVRRVSAPVLAGIAIALAACSTSRDAATDSAGSAGSAMTSAARTDTAMAGMAHDSAGGMTGSTAMNEPAPRDSNQAFLRMMVDHHEGLVVMARTAQGKLQRAEAKADAQKLLDKQAREQEQMKQMLASTYGDQHMPMVMPSNRAMNDSLRATQPGAAYDADFYHHVIAHHREGVMMTDKILPHLTGEVKAMAEKSRTDQQREITEFERKGGAGGRKG